MLDPSTHTMSTKESRIHTKVERTAKRPYQLRDLGEVGILVEKDENGRWRQWTTLSDLYILALCGLSSITILWVEAFMVTEARGESWSW